MSEKEPLILDQAGNIPVLPLRDVVIYPHMVTPLFVGRQKSIAALDAAMLSNKQILLVTQKNPGEDYPSPKQIYRVGTVSVILQLLKLPDGTIKVLIEGEGRAHVTKFIEGKDYLSARCKAIESSQSHDAKQISALMRSVVNQFEQYVKLEKKIPSEVLATFSGIDEPHRLIDMIAAHMPLRVEQKQKILEIADEIERLEYVLDILDSELDIMQIEKSIRGRVKQQMEKSQREYYLNEQMKAIQKELGGIDEDMPTEHEEYEGKIKKSGMSKEVKARAMSELNKMEMMSPMSAEATVVRNYLDWLVNVPWKKATKLKTSLRDAQIILDEDHYGLEKVKERILEYLAVQQRVKKLKGPILCLVGPPGVGKTSLGRSIARATGRKFTRMSLGGVRDEAEIRGHRRTYIGSMPGKFIQNLSRCGVKNPLFLLDEVDKMAMDFRGDPASALLEVLDPEQNNTFQDHYLEVEYNLSDVMFVCTANSLNIPPPLLDRMEVIRIAGYTEEEKKHIAEHYLIPRQIKDNGLKKNELKISAAVIVDIVRRYTREAGVRNLERKIAKICRQTVKGMLLGDIKAKAVQVTVNSMEKYLGVPPYRYGLADDQNRIGQVTGLAWTEAGGELLTVEAAVIPGKGKLVPTGHLGDVMKESVSAAVTVVRNRAKMLGIDPNFYESKDIHVHVPEGATPKDGPSAGIVICTALVSELTRIPARANVAMTGEITLRGEVLPIGGLKEKLLAALRGGIDTVLIPEENRKDLKELPANISQKLKICPVRWIDEVFEMALERQITPAGKDKNKDKSLSNKSSKSEKKGDWAPRH